MDALLNLIVDSFWLLLLIGSLYLIRHHRILAIILLMSQAVFGFVKWIILAIVIIAVILELVAMMSRDDKSKKIQEESESIEKINPDKD